MCHQTIEKILKATYIAHKEDVAPFSHNLGLLARKGGIWEQMNQLQRDLIDTLEPLNIEARYPTDKAEILSYLSRERCSALIDETRKLREWIENRL